MISLPNCRGWERDDKYDTAVRRQRPVLWRSVRALRPLVCFKGEMLTIVRLRWAWFSREAAVIQKRGRSLPTNKLYASRSVLSEHKKANMSWTPENLEILAENVAREQAFLLYASEQHWCFKEYCSFKEQSAGEDKKESETYLKSHLTSIQIFISHFKSKETRLRSDL